MIIDVPEGKDPLMFVWGELVPGIGPAAAAFSAAVYAHSTLSLREFEAARLTIARVNGCLFCLDYRTERGGEKVEEGFLDEVAAWRTSARLAERERLAAEYAERFAVEHHGLDAEFWTRMRAAYDDRQVVELTMCLGSWIAFGRLNRVTGLDEVCTLPAHIPGARS